MSFQTECCCFWSVSSEVWGQYKHSPECLSVTEKLLLCFLDFIDCHVDFACSGISIGLRVFLWLMVCWFLSLKAQNRLHIHVWSPRLCLWAAFLSFTYRRDVLLLHTRSSTVTLVRQHVWQASTDDSSLLTPKTHLHSYLGITQGGLKYSGLWSKHVMPQPTRFQPESGKLFTHLTPSALSASAREEISAVRAHLRLRQVKTSLCI